jgi:hypothetical protein
MTRRKPDFSPLGLYFEKKNVILFIHTIKAYLSSLEKVALSLQK